MEEMLRELLAGQKQLFEGQKQLFDGQKQLFEGQKQLFDGQKQLFQGQSRVESRLDSIESRLENLEGQVQENGGFIRALLHQSEYQKVQMDQLTHSTARIEGEVASIRTDLGAVEAITAKNWNDIIQLKIVK